MTSIDYHAGREFRQADYPPKPEDIECTLTESMLMFVVQEHADSPPPYGLSIHREMIWRLTEWELPKGLFELEVRTEDLNCRPLGKAVITFKSCDVAIYYRRQVCCVWEAGILEY